MNAFEQLVAKLLERDGYWVKINYKVSLTKEEKKKISIPSSPRWEVDMIAYKGETNELVVVECKSYLDSQGVNVAHFDGDPDNKNDRYKLFNRHILREVVFSRLTHQLEEQGLCRKGVKPRLCLAAGKIYAKRHKELHDLFEQRGWLLLDDKTIARKIKKLSETRYENEVAFVTAKLLLRNKDLL